MDVQTSKIELAKLILNLDNPIIIKKINDLIQRESGNFESTLTKEEKEEIQIAIRQLDEGKRTSFYDYIKKAP